MYNGALALPRVLDRAARQMLRDLFVTAQIWRREGQVDVLKGSFSTRLAATTTSDQGRDGQVVQGNVADRFFVALAPRYSSVEKDDEIWVGAARYRVVAVDPYPHKLQLLVKEIQ